MQLGISIKFNTGEANERRFICVKFYSFLGIFVVVIAKCLGGGSFFVDSVFRTYRAKLWAEKKSQRL